MRSTVKRMLLFVFCLSCVGAAVADGPGYRIYRKAVPRGAAPPTDLRTNRWELATPLANGVCTLSGAPCTRDDQCIGLAESRNKCTVPSDTLTTVSAVCDEDVDVYFAASLVFESGFETMSLSMSLDRHRCFECSGTDNDGDGYCVEEEGGMPTDCDDRNPNIRPFGIEVCDRVNNNCNDPDWPSMVGTPEFDRDGDGYSVCTGDCREGDASVFPGAPEVCDGRNNDCLDETWPALPRMEADWDEDTHSICEGDCDDTRSRTYPGAYQHCDRVNNDCSDPYWPKVPLNELDRDLDGYSPCEGDCNDTDSSVILASTAPEGACLSGEPTHETGGSR